MALALAAWMAPAAAEPPSTPVARPPGLVSRIKVLPDKAPDCSSLKALVASVTRDCRSNDEKAIALYNFMQLTHYHLAYPGEPGGLPVLKELNCYGWSLCGGLHAEQSALWRELGWDWRFVGWNGHTTVEARYDGRWHYLDVFLKFYAWMPDPNAPGGRTIAGEDDLNQNSEELIRNAFVLDQGRQCVYARDNQFTRSDGKMHWLAPSFLSCGDQLEDVISGLKTHRGADHSEGWMGIQHASGGYSAEVNLAPGFSLENTWDATPEAWYWSGSRKAPAHTCGGHKDTRNDPGIGLVLEPYVKSKPARGYANGTLSFAPDLTTEGCLRSFVSAENVRVADRALQPTDPVRPGVVVIELASPYILTRARGEAAGAEVAEVSADGGKTFKPVDLADFSAAVRGQVSALVRLTFKQPLQTLKLEATVQNNAGSLPYLSPGRNVVEVSVADPATLGDNRLAVTYAYRLGSRAKSMEQLYDDDKELAKAHDASWDEAVTCVQKVFTARELPATYEIDCPTPRGRYPVYPRMLFVRREVLAPGQQPAAVAAPQAADRLKPALQAAELATLPSPWTIGTQRPPAPPVRRTEKRTLTPTQVSCVSKKGEVRPHQPIKWLKDNSDAWIMLLGFDGVSLPKPDDLAGAKLILYIEEAHDKAPMQVAALMIEAPFEPGKPYDFAKLGRTAGSAVVQKGNGPGAPFKPPQRCEIDVTRAVRAWAGGARLQGLAVRIVPNRSVDDGWTVRFTPAPDKPAELEVVTYARE